MFDRPAAAVLTVLFLALAVPALAQTAPEAGETLAPPPAVQEAMAAASPTPEAQPPAPMQGPPQPSAIDFAAFDVIANRAEDTVEAGDIGTADLNALRAEMVGWRDRLTAGQDVNGTRINAVRDQIAALGPAPAEGETEPEEVAARRSALNAQLAELQAPRLAATEGATRAESIIRAIDGLITARQVSELTRVTSSPLLPQNWTRAGTEATSLLRQMTDRTQARFQMRGGWTGLGPVWPTVASYLVLAALLLTYGRAWIVSLPKRLSNRASVHSRAVLAFVVSIGQIVIPMIGVYLAVSALDATGYFGPFVAPVLKALPVAGLILFGGMWISRQVAPRVPIAYPTIALPDPEQRNRFRRLLNTLAAALAVHYILGRAILPLSGFADLRDRIVRVPVEFTLGAAGVLHFILIASAAVLLFRLGAILRRIPLDEAQERPSYRARILAVGGLVSKIVAVASVAVAAAGAVSLANVILWPWLMTLGLILILILLQDFTADLFEMATRGAEGAREGLGPILIGFALILLSAPLFALIWGAGVGDLWDWWARFSRGVTLGGVTLSPGAVVTFFIIFAIGYVITRSVQSAFRNTILPKTRLDAGGQSALLSFIGYIGIFLAALIAITSAGIDLSAFAIVAGALSVGIGFGLQNIVSNFVSGIILLIERPISVGDWIDAGGQQGIVKRISVRSTQVETFDRTEVVVPNSDLVTKPVVNWTKANKTGRVIIPVGVAYGTDTRKVEAILREIIEDQPLVTVDPAPAVLFRKLGADSLEFEIRAILSDVSANLSVTSDVLHAIVARFAEENIEVPFAQRDLWLRNPEALAEALPDTVPPPPPRRDVPMTDIAARDIPSMGEGDAPGDR